MGQTNGHKRPYEPGPLIGYSHVLRQRSANTLCDMCRGNHPIKLYSTCRRITLPVKRAHTTPAYMFHTDWLEMAGIFMKDTTQLVNR